MHSLRPSVGGLPSFLPLAAVSEAFSLHRTAGPEPKSRKSRKHPSLAPPLPPMVILTRSVRLWRQNTKGREGCLESGCLVIGCMWGSLVGFPLKARSSVICRRQTVAPEGRRASRRDPTKRPTFHSLARVSSISFLCPPTVPSTRPIYQMIPTAPPPKMDELT